MIEFIQSVEQYKGFTLEVVRYSYSARTALFHRECRMYKGGARLAIGKTKKEFKELIDAGIYE